MSGPGTIVELVQSARNGRSTSIHEWSTIRVNPADDKFKCKKLTRNLAQSAL